MQILPFILTQLPQFVLNLTNPSTSSSSSVSTASTALPNVNTNTDTPLAMQTGRYTLPALPYAYDALEPYISSTIMTLHHTKHHQAYVTNLNAAVAAEAPDVAAQIALQAQIRFNGGGHINHSLFWRNLAPAGSAAAAEDAAPKLMAAIGERYGGLGALKERFGKVLLGLQGSGWGWLVKDADGRLEIETTKDQDPVASGKQVILGVDMWEHAYYIQYYNNKAAYVEGIWNIINWEECEKRFLGLSELSL